MRVLFLSPFPYPLFISPLLSSPRIVSRSYNLILLTEFTNPLLIFGRKIESHLKRLDEDLNQFMEDLKQVPIVYKDEKRKGGYMTPQPRKFRERDWSREQDMDIEFMPPPSSHKKNIPASVDADQPIDPNEPTYCVCHQVSFGDMIACDNENSIISCQQLYSCLSHLLFHLVVFDPQCEGGEWFHYSCVGLTPETRFKGKWFCPTCRNQQ
ncbi:hypothetical protein B296_00052721 [Ensete ventricosum]|uniref:PHD-type domain-containing protein n=1 Tax=Ensete ventricosum TaxID=4639 RepID=A0A426Y4H8_ENSVE|nr:hypothetical protein B296_00052721 [Ensete ventricosum]